MNKAPTIRPAKPMREKITAAAILPGLRLFEVETVCSSVIEALLLVLETTPFRLLEGAVTVV